MLRKLPIVAVFGHGSRISTERARLAGDVGAMVARLGVHLLTGAGYGVMAAAAEGFVGVAERQGLSIGIVPRREDGPFDAPNRDPDGRAYPNPFIEIAIMTPLPPRAEDWLHTSSRNHINVLTADAALALPGGPGTRNELTMAAYYRDEVTRTPEERHTILVGPAEEFAPEDRQRFVHTATLADTEGHLRRVLVRQGYINDERAIRGRTVS